MSTESSKTKKGLGDRLRRLRKAKGFTQVELAQAIGTSQPMIALYEKHDAVPGPHVLLRLCEVLGATAEEILGLRSARRREKVESPDNIRLWRKLKQVESLPAPERRQVLQLIEALVDRETLRQRKVS